MYFFIKKFKYSFTIRKNITDAKQNYKARFIVQFILERTAAVHNHFS